MVLTPTSLENQIRQACLLEVRAEKPGNVSPTHGFTDASNHDFETSARVIAPIIARAAEVGVGTTILNAITATHEAVGHNTNLGIVLLLTPLACISPKQSLQDGIADVLQSLSVADATSVYEAINIASPGGLGDAEDQDVRSEPTATLLECMQLAASRDRIAAQYANGFNDVLQTGLTELKSTADWPTHHEQRLAWLALTLMSQFGDSLIYRKCGVETQLDVQQQATEVLKRGWPFAPDSWPTYRRFDQFLRADGHSRNPGTTADMIAAIVFAALREGMAVANENETQLLFTETTHG